MSFMRLMKDKTGLGNTGNVLHAFDEGLIKARESARYIAA
jgi:hypothetical protein